MALLSSDIIGMHWAKYYRNLLNCNYLGLPMPQYETKNEAKGFIFILRFEVMDLFAHQENQNSLKVEATHAGQPLAERLRPKSLDEFLGQNKFASASQPLIKNLRDKNFLPNLILWGPPGTGKTTFAKLLSQEMKAFFVSCNAIDTGAKELRALGEAAYHRRLQFQERTLIFIDEIHRLNKSQQDVLLPYTEKGDVTLIGATTENPSYELNSALLSRSQVLVFEKLSDDSLETMLGRAAQLYKISADQVLTKDARDILIASVGGDGRQLLNTFEPLLHLFQGQGDQDIVKFPITSESLSQLQFFKSIRYDKKGSEHYDSISAYIKSVRGSDPNAAIYYLARMLTGGEDPVFIARRLVILASEDIGNADPKALPLAIAALQAVELIGLPEARISLAQATVYLASAPKSNRSYLAINEALEFVQKTGALPIPLSLRSAQTKTERDLGYGRDYKYSHDYDRGYAKQKFMPQEAEHKVFYEPSEHGFEKNMKQYLHWLRGQE